MKSSKNRWVPLRSAAQRYPRIDAMSGQYKVAWLCEALLVSRSGYYDWKERWRQPGPRQAETIDLRARIREEFARSRRTYGSPRLTQVLGCPGRRNRIARLMRAERLFARQRSKYRHATTDSRHGGPIAPHRLQGLAVQLPNQAWATDATGILTGQGWLYLVAVLDLYSRRVVGWAMSPILDAPLTIAALRMALRQRRPEGSLIVHSDRGSQFASAAYRQVLAEHGLLVSMSRAGNCDRNGSGLSADRPRKARTDIHTSQEWLLSTKTGLIGCIREPTRGREGAAFQTEAVPALGEVRDQADSVIHSFWNFNTAPGGSPNALTRRRVAAPTEQW
ncbi:MAG: IS3 family transposase [Chthoniobacterales bacterium]